MTPSEREDIEKIIETDANRDIKTTVKMIEKIILTQVEKARRQQIEIDAKNYKRLVKIFLGEEAEIEFSEKMAKGWNNLMKFLSEESATN